MRKKELIKRFITNEKSGSIILIACTFVSLLLANVFPDYNLFWNLNFAGHHLVHWINDGLMAIFFLMVGLELKREFLTGSLSDIRQALTPIIAAIGGVIVPALIYYFININGGNTRGVGIPMATDIVFALGVLSLLGTRVPPALKVFLLALAVIDDLCAILVIAVFYNQGIQIENLAIACGIIILLMILSRWKVRSVWIYLIIGIVLWYFMLHSGIHASITGVILALFIPFSNSSPSEQSPSDQLQHALHLPVTFFILPVFALANTSIVLSDVTFNSLINPVSIGVMMGLIFGKPLGIFLFTFMIVQLGIGSLPATMRWKHVWGIGILGGIGFTISIFMSILAFDAANLIALAKISVLIASVISGILGYIFMKRILP